MKVVIKKKCGINITDEIFEMVLERKGIEFIKIMETINTNSTYFQYYQTNHISKYNIKIYNYFNETTNNRTDTDLIYVIEKINKKITEEIDERNKTTTYGIYETVNKYNYSKYYDFKIIEIPDDKKWHIVADNLGIETVVENHEIWY